MQGATGVAGAEDDKKRETQGERVDQGKGPKRHTDTTRQEEQM